MSSPEARPSPEPLSCAIKLIKEERDMSLQNLADQLGVTKTSVWNYLNCIHTPRIEVIGGLLEQVDLLPENTPYQEERRGELRERLVQGFVPQLIYFSGQEEKNGYNRYNSPREVNLTDVAGQYSLEPEKRKINSQNKTRIPSGSSPDATLIDNILKTGLFASGRELSKTLGVSATQVYLWRTGKVGISKRFQEVLNKLLEKGEMSETSNE